MEGFVAGTVSSVICHPLETIHTNLQLKQKICIRNVYNGFIPGIMSKSIFYGTFFPLYKTFLENNCGVFSGYFASNVASVLSNPFFVLKTRHQLSQFDTFRHIVRKEGVGGCFKGLGITFLKNIELGIQLPVYDYLRKNEIDLLFASVVSKLFATSLSYPLDTMRTIQRSEKRIWTILQLARQTGLYNGYMFYIFRSIPHTMITFYIYENWKNWNIFSIR